MRLGGSGWHAGQHKWPTAQTAPKPQGHPRTVPSTELPEMIHMLQADVFNKEVPAALSSQTMKTIPCTH